MEKQYKEELSTILEILTNELDISKTEYEVAIKSYEAVGDWLSRQDSSIAKYEPEILPQGSFMLGTMVKPVNESDDLDIDLVCRFKNKPSFWTQHDLKEAVGNRLKEHKKYESMLESKEGGRRCWTLEYKLDSGYHMDILPSIAGDDFEFLFQESFGNMDSSGLEKLAIRITDRERPDFKIEIDLKEWYKSNPFGYARWFFKMALIYSKQLISLKSAIEPVRDFTREKLPLQRIVQILKRHRDIMFCDNSEYDLDHKPISIIITTLAARAYAKEDNILDGLTSVVAKIRGLIEERWNDEENRYEKWVVNPVNDEENFADKWSEETLKRDYFYEWLDKLEEDVAALLNSQGGGIYELKNKMTPQFGENLTGKVFKSYGDQARILTESGKRKMAHKSGLLGASGVPVKKHNFEGLNG